MNPRKVVPFFLVALLVATLGFAADGQLTTMKGQVVSLDLKMNTLTVKSEAADGKQVTVQLAADTKILKAGATIGAQEIGVGDKVTVNGKVVDGKWTAVTIGVEPKP